ncbi:MAG: SDR family oxidoreductase [Geitlerinemataceae cyanobacterium]
MSDFNGKYALVTGASSGIGRAIALVLAKAGADLILVSRSMDKLEKVAEEVRACGVSAHIYAIDLADVANVREKVAAIGDRHPIDILVNNAGMGYTGNLDDMPLESWQTIMDLNVTSVFQCVQALLPGLRERNGAIVNVVSVAGQQVFPGWVGYCTSKFALMALSRGIAAEERANGIRVTAICPGSVNTPIWDTDTVDADFDRNAMLTPETVAEAVLGVLSLPDSAVVEELTLMPSAGVL